MDKEKELSKKYVRDVRNLLVDKASVVDLERPVSELLEVFLEDPHTRHVYVLDSQERLAGTIRMNTMVEYLFPYTALSAKCNDILSGWLPIIGAKTAREIMNPDPLAVREDTPLADVARILMREKINELPVIDDDHRIIGQINVFEIICSYLQGLKKCREEQ